MSKAALAVAEHSSTPVPVDPAAANIDALTRHIDAAALHIDNVGTHIDRLARSLEVALRKPPEPFLGMHTPDWIQAGLLGIALAGLIYTGMTLAETARGRDVENYLKFLDIIATAWRRFGNAPGSEKRFEFLELMNLIESTCHMYNKRVLRGTTSEMASNYLRDILPVIYADPDAMVWIAQAQNRPDTYRQIRYFAHSIELPGVPHELPPKRWWHFRI